VSHGVGFVAALAVTPLLVREAARRGGAFEIVGASVFAATVAVLYLSSTLYHALPKNRAKRVFRIIASIGALQVAVVLVNLLRSKVIAVLLGPAGFGVVSVIDQLVQLVLYVSTLSLPFAATRFLSRAHSEGPESFRRSYSSFLGALLLTTMCGLLIGAGLAVVRPDLLGDRLYEYRAFLLPALISIPAMACHGLFNNVLAAARRTMAAALMTLVIAAGLAATTLAGVLTWGIPGLYWGNLVANVLVAVGVALYLRKSLALPLFRMGQGIRQELRQNPDIVLFAVTFYANSIAYSGSFFVARYGVLAHFGETEAGLLQACIALFTSINLVLGRANGLYLTPLLNRRGTAAEKARAMLEFQRKHWIAVLFVAFPIVLFAPWILVLLFSSSFVSAANLVVLFVMAQALMLMGGNYYALLIGLGDLKGFGVLSVLGHASVAGLVWLLAPSWGIAGVGVGFVLGYAIHYVLTVWRLRVTYQTRIPRRWWFTLGYGLLALALGGVVAAVTDAWSPWVIVAKFVGCALFAASLLALFDRHELHQLVTHGQRLLFPGGVDQKARVGGGAYRRLTQHFFPEAW